MNTHKNPYWRKHNRPLYFAYPGGCLGCEGFCACMCCPHSLQEARKADCKQCAIDAGTYDPDRDPDAALRPAERGGA